MKNCLEFVVTELTSFIITFGVFAVLDVFCQFQVITDVVTLDRNYLKTNDLSKMAYGATRSPQGYLNLKAQSDLVKMLITIICNPGSPEEAVKINTSLKTLCMKIYNDAGRFLSEGRHRRMMFQIQDDIKNRLCEIYKMYMNCKHVILCKYFIVNIIVIHY